MRFFSALAVALLALPAGCSLGVQPGAHSQTNPARALNSDRIRQRFGSYGVKVLRQDEQLRVSNLHSTHAGQAICRTFAVVRFAQPIPAELSKAHAAIGAGGSIGEVLRQQGWQIKKQRLQVTTLNAMPGSEAGRLMGLTEATALATDVYQLSAQRGARTLNFATIAEIHHPDYLDATLLDAMVVPSRSDVDSAGAMLRLAEQFLTQGPLRH